MSVDLLTMNSFTRTASPDPSMTLGADLPKTYDASFVEDGIYAAWEDSGAFNPDTLPERNQAGEPYCIVMPPPNRTGTLHLGHATMLAIEDMLIRFHRMRGKRTLWIPGTDHAAIATQVKVEQELVKQGMKDPRRELGREKFLEKVVAFADASAKTIRAQMRKMGSSCDWSRERYTLDEARSCAVFEVFKMMYEDGIIERGHRIVNWDPQFQTTLSDDEVLTTEVTAKLLTFTYDADFPIAISTTRPETKFGDTAVAVHPDDTRYTRYVGKTFTPTFCGKRLEVKIISDDAVDPEFGTGALGVTPAHSMIDAEMAERHDLSTIQVIGSDARMLDEAGKAFAGLTIVEARTKIEQMLQAANLLVKVEDVQQNLPVAERGGAAVEQLPMRQWFIRVNKPFQKKLVGHRASNVVETITLKTLMREAVESKHINIIPERFEKMYFHWIDNLRDWCISRQIWFGHRIPVWYRKSGVVEEEIIVSETSPGPEWEQDPDTLDTWFSAGLWTFSALGWPNTKAWEEHRDYHPTAVLETGYDILFFWVARMILMSTYALGEMPFKDVYLHGLVR
ncbi:MAG: valine--tRNA ligase, partial [Patescibacteria group bacterium]